MDITGHRFGKLLAVRRVDNLNGHAAWLCRCDCGVEKTIRAPDLRAERTRSCGCGAPATREMVGQRFGRLTVRSRSAGSGKPRWVCDCDCGNTATILGESLRSGNTQSCGCLLDETRRVVAHGGARLGRWAPEYGIWCAMRYRCTNPRNGAFRNYGGRGIRVCDRWLRSFAAFRQDMGPRPSPSHSIDRIDVNGNYEPANCRWADAAAQCRNRRNTIWLTVDGVTRCLSEWCELSGLSAQTLMSRINRGWAPERAVRTPHLPKKHPAPASPSSTCTPMASGDWLW